MGISAQQHRVSIGLFYNNKVKVCRRRECGDIGYKICCTVLGILYFYILIYIMIMSLNFSQSASTSHCSPIIRPMPDLQSSINLYFLLAMFTALEVFIDRCEVAADLSYRNIDCLL